MKTIISAMMIISFIGSQAVIITADPVKEYVYQNSTMSAEHNDRYVDVIYKYSGEYGLDPLLIARQVWYESRFKWYAYNVIGAYGPMQIRPKFWSHILYHVDDGKLGMYLLKKESPKYHRYFMRIGYGVEAGCMIMAHLKKLNDYDYRLALIEYWAGRQSDYYKRAQRSKTYAKTIPYVKYINEVK